jgi:hypothetical protein
MLVGSGFVLLVPPSAKNYPPNMISSQCETGEEENRSYRGSTGLTEGVSSASEIATIRILSLPGRVSILAPIGMSIENANK